LETPKWKRMRLGKLRGYIKLVEEDRIDKIIKDRYKQNRSPTAAYDHKCNGVKMTKERRMIPSSTLPN